MVVEHDGVDAARLPLLERLAHAHHHAQARVQRLLRLRRDLCGNQIYGAFVLNRRVDLHAIDATPARWRGDVGSSPLDGASA